jgi:hypothetical protein
MDVSHGCIFSAPLHKVCEFRNSLFSRADKVRRMSRASAPANLSLAEFAFRSDFFRNLFSRAKSAARNARALAPEGLLLPN